MYTDFPKCWAFTPTWSTPRHDPFTYGGLFALGGRVVFLDHVKIFIFMMFCYIVRRLENLDRMTLKKEVYYPKYGCLWDGSFKCCDFNPKRWKN